MEWKRIQLMAAGFGPLWQSVANLNYKNEYLTVDLLVHGMCGGSLGTTAQKL